MTPLEMALKEFVMVFSRSLPILIRDARRTRSIASEMLGIFVIGIVDNAKFSIMFWYALLLVDISLSSSLIFS